VAYYLVLSQHAESKALELLYEYGVTALQATEKMEVVSPVLLLYFPCLRFYY